MAHDQGAIAARPQAPDRRTPTAADTLLFALKTRAFQLRRALTEAAVKHLPQTDDSTFTHSFAQTHSPLWADPRLAEAAMQRGKVHNLRAAARRLDRTMLAPGVVFSFWAQLGRATRARGFARGRMLQEGCLVASTGGGLCQLSNALYDVALQAGCEIVERHAHSRSVPGSAAATGRDATVAWNYVDLRFRSPRDLMLRVRLTRDTLIVGLYGETTDAVAPNLEAPARASAACS